MFMKPVEALWGVEKPTETKAPILEPEQTATLAQTRSGDVYGILIDLARQLPKESQTLIADELQRFERFHALAHQIWPNHPDHTLPKTPTSVNM